jgi:glycerol uptake facilitator protein
MSAYVGEFLGTFFLIVLGVGVVANVLLTHSKGENAGWLSITFGWAIAVIMGVFVAQSTGSVQADINPAVSFAKYWLGIYTLPVFLKTALVQTFGAFCGAVTVWLVYLLHWKATDCSIKKLAVYSTSPAIRHLPSNLLTEIICTLILVLGVAAIFGHATAGQPVVGLGPYLVGMLVLGIGLSLGGPTGYATNPARDLGPRIAHAVLPIPGKGASDWSYAWVPVVGPLIGGTLGAFVWKVLF